MKALAELIPILGASVVIGGNRAKLFSDGVPTTQTQREYSANITNNVVLTTGQTAHLDQSRFSNERIEEKSSIVLPERPRPDGYSIEEGLDNWEDWELNDNTHNNANANTVTSSTTDDYQAATAVSKFEDSDVNVKPAIKINQNNSITDISQLDIKNQVNKDNEIDFFGDMEPVIDNSNKFLITDVDNSNVDSDVASKLALQADEDVAEGWGDGEWD